MYQMGHESYDFIVFWSFRSSRPVSVRRRYAAFGTPTASGPASAKNRTQTHENVMITKKGNYYLNGCSKVFATKDTILTW